MITPRFKIEPRPTTIPSVTTWCIKDLRAPAGCASLVIAVCDSEDQAQRVACALAAYRLKMRYTAPRRKGHR